MTSGRFTRKTAPQDRLDYRNWPEISTEGYSSSAQRRVAVLSAAIRDYIDGKSFDEHLRQSGIYRETLLRTFNRCIATDQHARLLGWRALCPNLRIAAPVRQAALIACGRNKRGGLSGALSLFLQQHPKVGDKFDTYILQNAKRKPGCEARLRHKSAHQKFIELCSLDGVHDTEWPLCTRRHGVESIRKYVERFLEKCYDDIVATQYGDRAKARSHTATGYPSRLTALRPFDIVEIDEHRCEFMGSIGIPTPEGMRWEPIERIVIIVAVDRCLNVILGYKVIFRREANADDLLDVLNCAMGNGAPRVFVDGYEAEFKGGLPCGFGAPFKWCGFNQVLFDNALIHLAAEVSERARNLTGADFNFGVVRRFERRPTVENVFAVLERAGFRRLQMTTGTSPKDPIRQHPEKAAVAARLSVQMIMSLIEGVILDYNGNCKKSNFGSTPVARLLAVARDEDAKGIIIPELPPLAYGVPSLDVSVVSLTIRGRKEDGRRPYVTFEAEAYTGPILAHDWSLLAKQVVGHVKRRAIREIRIFGTAGDFIDTARVMGRWAQSEHSSDIRKHINGLIKQGQLSVPYAADPVNRFLEKIKQQVAGIDGSSDRALQSDLGFLATEVQARMGDSTWNTKTPESSATDVAEPAGAKNHDAPSGPGIDIDNDAEFLDYPGLTAMQGGIA